MTSIYVRMPGGFLVEYGWGGRHIDPANWRAERMGSVWVHDCHRAGADAVAKGREMRMAAAARGERAPVQVLLGGVDQTSRLLVLQKHPC
jgi:hypothetical protein